MISRILISALAAAFLSTATLTPTVVLAQAAKKEEPKAKKESKKESKEKKELSPQQQKMKDCAGKWGEEKKAKKVSGRKAYNEFMSGCLKG
jgi:hypothetical protein